MTEKIIIKLAGGLGNQLFQLVFGLSVANKFGASAEIDESSFINYGYHHEPEIHKLGFQLRTTDLQQEAEKGGLYLLNEEAVASLDSIAALPSECRALMLNGYWQSEAYLSKSVVDVIFLN